jgi:hypothetical protein
MKFNIFSKLALGALAFAFVACDEDYEKAAFDTPVAPSHDLPTVTTGDPVAVTGTAAILSISVDEVVEGNPVLHWGVLLSTNDNPGLAGSTISYANVEETSTNLMVGGLVDETTYYYRTFAHTEGGVAYGEVKSFGTSTEAWEQEWSTVENWLEFTDAAKVEAAFPYRAILDATHSSAQPFMYEDASLLFGPGVAALVSSPFDADVLFSSLSGSLVCYGVHNIAGTYQDFSDLAFPKVTLDMVMMQMLFGMTDLDGHVDVYVSDKEITTAEDLAAATLIGSTRNNGQASVDYIRDNAVSAENPMSFDIPSKFWGPCYIYLSHKANYNNGVPEWAPDLGVVITGVGFSGYTQGE